MMEHQKLMRTAFMNSTLLAVNFAATTASSFMTGHPILGAVGVIATILTGLDVSTFWGEWRAARRTA